MVLIAQARLNKAGLGYERHFTPSSDVVFKGVKPFSAAYNDAVDIANKNRLTFLSLTYATILENVLLQPEINHGCA